MWNVTILWWPEIARTKQWQTARFYCRVNSHRCTTASRTEKTGAWVVLRIKIWSIAEHCCEHLPVFFSLECGLQLCTRNLLHDVAQDAFKQTAVQEEEMFCLGSSLQFGDALFFSSRKGSMWSTMQNSLYSGSSQIRNILGNSVKHLFVPWYCLSNSKNLQSCGNDAWWTVPDKSHVSIDFHDRLLRNTMFRK